MAENSWLSQLWLGARRCVYALERDSNRGSTPAVFIELSEGMSVTDLCHEYGISSPAAYKWIKRYDEVGPEGLLDLAPTPHSSPHATSAEIENEILALRKRFPSWGARKLKARLERMNPNVSWPAASTVGGIPSRAGLTNPKRKKRRATPSSQPFSMVTAPNQLWCMDFKRYFLTGDGLRCDPFTVTDAHSRFLIRWQAVARMDLAQVRAVCDAAMREFGVPERIRTDNGAHSPALACWGFRSCHSDG